MSSTHVGQTILVTCLIAAFIKSVFKCLITRGNMNWYKLYESITYTAFWIAVGGAAVFFVSQHGAMK